MPSFSMCQNFKCKQKYKCLRFTAKPNSYQSYSYFDEDKCEFFITNKNK